ncbi:hypothetical protein PV328_002858 [Microctonus aethiopoides]|uniref:Major facilitator superfamily (MFS) profile domain-containing protein n=1 Tax=Microctonus aethiopoides TaxID=144406 RepID=A0AA39F7A3_9HYME|nr:hypothetical protein PV328_002858 [Microctonus aethiopoides]
MMENNELTMNFSINNDEDQNNDSTSHESVANYQLEMTDKKATDENVDMDFDDLLPCVGEFGFYQRQLFFCMIPFIFFLVFVYFGQIFITLVPGDHWCRIPELEDLTVEQRMALAIPLAGETDDATTLGYSKCLMYNVNFTEILMNGTISFGNPKWPTQKCQFGWEYNFDEIPYETIATENDWVCDNAALPTISQSIFFVGAIFGGILFGGIADHYGRIPAIVLANLSACIAGIATAFTNNFWQFTLTRFFVGMAYDTCFAMMYILVLEYVGPKWRTFVANISIGIFFTCASCLLPWIAYFLANWRYTVLAVSIPLILTIFTPWIVPESARWLVSQGKVDEAIEILKKIEKYNCNKVPDNIYKRFKESCERLRKHEVEGKIYTAIDLFRTPQLRKVTILLTVIWMIISLVFDGHVRNIDNLGLNIFITFTIASAMELPADICLTLVLDRWGRRWVAFGTMVIAGFFSILACTVSNTSLAIAGRFFVNISYNIGLLYAAESLPTVVRAQGVAFIHLMGCISNILSPFVVYLVVISPVLPLLLLGILGIIGGTLALLLPETLNQELPQTLQDGEDFGKDQGFWDMPCFIKNADDELKPESIRQNVTDNVRNSERLYLRGEVLRSSMISRSSIRSRNRSKNTTDEIVSIQQTLEKIEDELKKKKKKKNF